MNPSDRKLVESLFAGSGEMATRMRELDWSATPLGPLEQWPQALRTSVRIVLDSACAMAICWGPDFAYLYNDGYMPLIGTKHPAALGRACRDVFPEALHIVDILYYGSGRPDSWSTCHRRLIAATISKTATSPRRLARSRMTAATWAAY